MVATVIVVFNNIPILNNNLSNSALNPSIPVNHNSPETIKLGAQSSGNNAYGAEDVDRLTSYAVMIGRAMGCGSTPTFEAGRVGGWIVRTFQRDHQHFQQIFHAGIKHHAEWQIAGNSPDSCSTVKREFRNTNWP